MSYLAAYRAGSEKYGNNSGGGKAFKTPSPYKPPTKPGAANDNTPRPANDNRPASSRVRALLRLTKAGRAILRKHPYLNAAMTAYDLWRLYNGQAGQGQLYNLAGWTSQQFCLAGPTHYRQVSGNTPWPSVPCFTGSLDSGARGINLPFLNNAGRLRLEQFIGRQVPSGNPLYDASEYLWRPVGGTWSGTRIARQIPRVPKPMPVIDPNLLPIRMPMPLPVPIPLALAPYRANDPIGSWRTNGDRRVRFEPRRPPPPGTKEQKIKAIPAVVRALTYATTEGLDFLDALHKALPDKYQAKAVFRGGKWWNASPQAKSKALYDHFEHLDWTEAAKNVVVNHFTDLVIGRSSAKAKKFLDTRPGGRIVGGTAIFGGGV